MYCACRIGNTVAIPVKIALNISCANLLSRIHLHVGSMRCLSQVWMRDDDQGSVVIGLIFCFDVPIVLDGGMGNAQGTESVTRRQTRFSTREPRLSLGIVFSSSSQLLLNGLSYGSFSRPCFKICSLLASAGNAWLVTRLGSYPPKIPRCFGVLPQA
jgi:hypothetical protein